MAAPVIAPPTLIAIGESIGRYEIAAEIASGGMGRVYLARARGPAGFEKLVALKCINPDLATEQSFIDMFFDEARIASRIDHPNVCRVFDFGEAGGRYFIAMEYLIGEPVTRVARKLAAPGEADKHDEIVARIIAEAAEGLHAAHELADEYGRPLEIVHRDVSPQNLFVSYDGGVRVVDFGIASAQGRLHRTSTGSIKGKLAYMAPEQMRREAADRRVDVWALGVVLWELLTRRRLFTGANEVEIMLGVLNDEVPRPTTVRPSLDRELEVIVMRALEKDVAKRYATARELAAALNRWTVSRGLVVGMAEMAAFMSTTFPAERVARFELVDSARRLETQLAAALDIPVTEDAGEKSAIRETQSSTPQSQRSARPKRSAVLLTIAGIAALLAASSLGAWVAKRDDSAPIAPLSPTHAVIVSATPVVPPATEGRPPTVAPPTVETVPAPVPTVVPEAAPAPVPTALPEAPPTIAAPSPRRGHNPTRGDARPAPAAPSASTGRLHVETPGGWADVYANGRRLGRTPLDVELPVGRTAIELRPFGLAPMSGASAMRRNVTIGPRPSQIRAPIDA